MRLYHREGGRPRSLIQTTPIVWQVNVGALLPFMYALLTCFVYGWLCASTCTHLPAQFPLPSNSSCLCHFASQLHWEWHLMLLQPLWMAPEVHVAASCRQQKECVWFGLKTEWKLRILFALPLNESKNREICILFWAENRVKTLLLFTRPQLLTTRKYKTSSE